MSYRREATALTSPSTVCWRPCRKSQPWVTPVIWIQRTKQHQPPEFIIIKHGHIEKKTLILFLEKLNELKCLSQVCLEISNRISGSHWTIVMLIIAGLELCCTWKKERTNENHLMERLLRLLIQCSKIKCDSMKRIPWLTPANLGQTIALASG